MPKVISLASAALLAVGAVVVSVVGYFQGWITSVTEYTTLVVSGVVVVMLAGSGGLIWESFKHHPSFVFAFDVRNEEKRLGIAVATVRGTIKNAQAKVDRLLYKWELGPNNEVDKKDIIAGEEPSVFFPYRVSHQFLTFGEIVAFPLGTDLIIADYKAGSIPPSPPDQDMRLRRGFLLEVRGATKDEVIYRFGHATPDLKGFTIFDPAKGAKNGFDITLKITGEGLEEAKNVKGRISIQNVVVLNLDKPEPAVTYGFQFTERK